MLEIGIPTVTEDRNTYPKPLQINNNSLFDPHNTFVQRLKSGLQEGKDFKLVFESTWQLLHGWYGGGAACMRRWIGGMDPWHLVHALQLIIRRSPDQKECQVFLPGEVRHSLASVTVAHLLSK